MQVYPLKELYFSSTSNLDQYQIAYAEALIEYNRDVLNGKTRVDILSKFTSVVSPHDQVYTSQMNDITVQWRNVQYIFFYFVENR